MRTIFFLRGIPGYGKSFWLQQNQLTPYTICADELRLLFAAPILDNQGQFTISQNHDKRVRYALTKENLIQTLNILAIQNILGRIIRCRFDYILF